MPTKRKLEIVLRLVKDLKPCPRNMRVHGERNLDAIQKSYAEFDEQLPVLIDRDDVVWVGNARLEIAKREGRKQINCVVTDLPPKKIRAYAIADNKIPLLGEWADELADVLQRMRDEDAKVFEATGFNDDDLSDLLDEQAPDIEEDAIPEPPAKPITKPGDLWLLGKHRLLCGDSTNADHVKRLMNGQRAALFSTDPPYLVEYNGTNHPGKHKAKRNKDWGELYQDVDAKGLGREFYLAFCKVAIEHAITPRAAWYCWHASRRQAMLESVWEECGAFVHQQIIWAKSRGVLTRSVHLWAHEPCLFGWIQKQKPRVNRVLPASTTVWQIPNSEIESHDHPTSKPVQLFTRPMELHTKRGEICYEPFSGSGSQLIGAERTGRLCYAMELQPAFVDVGVMRWEALTGQKARRAKA